MRLILPGRIRLDIMDDRWRMSPADQVLRFDHLGIAHAISKRGDRFILTSQEMAHHALRDKVLIWKREQSKEERRIRREKYIKKGWRDENIVSIFDWKYKCIPSEVFEYGIKINKSHPIGAEFIEIINRIPSHGYLAGGCVANLIDSGAMSYVGTIKRVR